MLQVEKGGRGRSELEADKKPRLEDKLDLVSLPPSAKVYQKKEKEGGKKKRDVTVVASLARWDARKKGGEGVAALSCAAFCRP